MPEPDFSELLKKLEQDTNWPQLYMFKFIVPADNKHIAQVENMFGDESQVSTKESSGGKYISITARQVMLDPASVIEIYRLASRIEGLMAL